MATLLNINDFLNWPTPNYVNPTEHGPALMVVNILFLSLMTIIVILRLVSKIFIKRQFGLDDFFIIWAWIFTVGIHAVVMIGILKYGWNRHTWDVPTDWAEANFKITYAGEALFLLACQCTACSMFAFYYRLNRNVEIRWFKWFIWGAIAFNQLTWTPIFFIHLFPCSPIRAYWTFPPMYQARCVDFRISTFGGGVLKLFMDIFVTTMPIPLILRLKMSRGRKLGIVFILSLGYMACIAGGFRIYYSHLVYWETTDLVWYEYPSFLVSTVENDLGVIAACLPFIRPIFVKYAESIRRSAESYAHASPQRPNEKQELPSDGSNSTGQRELVGKQQNNIQEEEVDLTYFICNDSEDNVEQVRMPTTKNQTQLKPPFILTDSDDVDGPLTRYPHMDHFHPCHGFEEFRPK